LAVVCLSCVTSASAGATAYVDGVSDQYLMSWAGNYSDASGYNTPFPSFFANSWVGSPASHIKLARYVVQWDAMKGVGYSGELADLESWYSHTTELHLTPEVALDNYNCSGCSVPKTTEEYTKALEALHSAFPGISVVEAWNEPNNEHYTSYVTPVAAAHFMNAAYSFCAGHGCTAVAGDLLDSESNMVKYEGEYESNLNPRDPGNWGIHPYHAVKYESSSTVTSFLDALPSPTTDHVWFTEVGAYYCETGTLYGPSSQEKNAKYLVNHLIPEFAPTHVFYYTAAWHYDEKPPCNSGTEDTALYAAESTGGPVLARPAAKVIFGPEGAPSATTGSSSGLQPLQATVSGSINPQGLDDTEYYFEYGTSTSYGSSTPRGNAGPGLNSVGESATISSLKPGTTYHYRIVATSTAGTTPGSDGTFQTPGPVEAVTGTASDIQEEEATLNGTVNPRGYDAKYYFQYGETTTYGASTPEGDAGAGSSPVAATPATITHLRPGTTYHFRLVATSGGVISEGHDQTFTTASLQPATTIDREGNHWTAVEGTNHTLDVYELQSNGKSFGPVQIGAPETTYSTPAIVVDAENNRWIVAEGADNSLDMYWQSQSTGEWAGPQEVAGAGTTYSAPSLAVDKEGNLWTMFEGASNRLELYWLSHSTGKWAGPQEVGGVGTAHSTPSLAFDSEGNLWTMFEGASNRLELYWLSHSTGKWAGPQEVGGVGTAYSTPALAFDKEGNLWTTFEGASNSLVLYWLSHSTAQWAGPDAIGGAGTAYSAPALVIDKEGNLWTMFEGASNSLVLYWASHSDGQWAGPDAVGKADTAYSAPSLAVDSEDNLWTTFGGASNSLALYWLSHSTGEWAGPDEIGTGGMPDATTEGVSSINAATATVDGSVNPVGVSTSYQFEYGPTTSYGTSVPAGGSSAGSGESTVNENAAITGLQPATLYHYRIVATSGRGTTYGVDRVFTTTTWATESTPNATGAPNNRLTGVSCTSSTFCFATAYEIYNGISYAYGESWNGSTWTIQSGIEPNAGIQFAGVSCASATSCTAVGSLTETNGNVVTLAEYWNGTKWARQTTPNATGAPNNRLTGVSCTSSTFCFATAYEIYNGISYAYGESWNGSTWTIQSGIEPNAGIQFAGVSCASATSCTAVGSLTETNGNVVTLAEYWNGTKWARQTTPNEPGATSNQLAGVSCATICTAVGSYTNGSGVWTLAERHQ
jgi:hypothetical protein